MIQPPVLTVLLQAGNHCIQVNVTPRLKEPPYYVVSGYKDQITDHQGTWRINFIFDKGKHDTVLVTLLDETNSVAILTTHMMNSGLEKALFKMRTPLQRLPGVRQGGDLWDFLRDEDADS